MKIDKKKWSRIGIVITFIFALYLLVFAISSKQINKYHRNTNVVLDNGWTLDFNGQVTKDYSFGNQRMPITNKGDKIILTKVLPSELPLNPVLCVRTIHSDIAIYIDGEEIYAYGQDDYDAGRYVSSGTQYIDMMAGYAGEELKIVLRVSENHAFSSLATPYISNSNYVHRDYIIKHHVELLCILFLIVLGLLGMGLAFLKTGDSAEFRPLWGIAAFAFSVGMWSLCTTDLMGYFTYNIKLKNVTEYVSLYATPLFAFSYFGYEIDKESKIRKTCYSIIHVLLGVFLIGSCVLHALNIVRFPSVLLICHILIVAVIIYVISTSVYDAMHGKSSSKVLMVGVACLIVFVSLDLINFNIKKYFTLTQNDYYASVIYIGVLCFIISLIYDFLDKTIKNAFKRVELETLEKMAYTDMLTGIANRRKCDEILDTIMSENLPYAVICFDLNNLKLVNDTQGHPQGDAYICAFARVLEKVFDTPEAKRIAGGTAIARNGGDEFVALLYGNVISCDFIKERIEEMNRLIDEVNKTHRSWNMSTAYGVVISTEDSTESTKQAIKLADERLYENKYKMKHAVVS